MFNDILWLTGFFIAWFLLMRFILPALGIPTCMTGACNIRKEEEKDKDAAE